MCFGSLAAAPQVYINIVMEYCDGGDLTGQIRGRKGVLIPEDEVMNKFVQVGAPARSLWFESVEARYRHDAIVLLQLL